MIPAMPWTETEQLRDKLKCIFLKRKCFLLKLTNVIFVLFRFLCWTSKKKAMTRLGCRAERSAIRVQLNDYIFALNLCHWTLLPFPVYSLITWIHIQLVTAKSCNCTVHSFVFVSQRTFCCSVVFSSKALEID